MKKRNYIILFIALVVVLCVSLTLAVGCGDKNPTPEPPPPGPTYSDDIEEKPTQFAVSATQGEGYKILSASSVLAGETLNFTVEFDANFDVSGATVKANDSVVAAKEGVYSVENVSQNLTLTVTNLVRSAYSVMFAPVDGVKLMGNATVGVGENYSFSISLEEGVTKTADFVVKVNGQAVTATNDNYSVSNVTSDLIITVSGVQAPYYAVNDTTNSIGYKLSSGATSVMQGKDYVFAVNVDEAYEQSADFAVTVNGQVVVAQDGVYTVKNVQGDLNIAVNGLGARQTFTVNYVNCDLQSTTEYVGSLFNLQTPTRANYLFAGWKDENGNDFVMDYSGDITVYASWYTNSKVDYFARCLQLARDIETRYLSLEQNNQLNLLNVNDYAMYAEYKQMYDCFTDYERTKYTQIETVTAFIERAINLPHEKLAETTSAVANTCIVNGEEALVVGMRDQLSIANGGKFDGSRYYMQYPKDNHSLQYVFKISGVNFKKYCDNSQGRVSFYILANYAQLSIFCGDVALAYTTEANTLHRVDIQDGYLYYDEACRVKLSDDVYNGLQPLVLTVNTLCGASTFPYLWGRIFAKSLSKRGWNVVQKCKG